MKRHQFSQIKELNLKELKEKAKVLRQEIGNLVVDKNMKKLKDLKMISKKRKELAQTLTVLRQKEMLLELESVIDLKESEVKRKKKVQEGEG